MTTSIREAVRGFIVENFLFGDSSQPFGDSDSLIENGVVDSTGVLELICFIEDRFGVVVTDSEILPANLDSISRIETFVLSRTAPLTAA